MVTHEPWPASSGETRRLAGVLEALDAVCDLTVVVLEGARVPQEQPPLQGTVHRVRRDTSRRRSMLAAVQGVLRLRPLTAAFYIRPELRRELAALLDQCRPDVVWTRGVGGAELIRGLVAPDRVIFDADTIDPRAYARIARDSHGLTRLQWALDVPLLALWLRRRLPSYGEVCVVSDTDLASFRRWAPGASYTVVPNGVDLPTKACPGDPAGPLLFLGHLGYPPNASALRWLVDAVLPLDPALRLVVAGNGDVPTHPQVDAVGFVADLGPLWRGASALVAPIRSGGGTRIKVLEALAHGLPVISTELGVEGLDLVPETHYLRAETPEQVVRQAARLRADPDLRSRMSRAGREVVQPHAWLRAAQPLTRLVTQ